MDLLTLSLRSPLPYEEAEPSALLAALAAGSLREGDEAVFAFDYDVSAVETPEGPRWKPGALPFRAGRKERGATGPAFSLPAGEYLFQQSPGPYAGPASLDAACEAFARDAWWTGSGGSGPLYARVVAEDGKAALQVIRAP